MVITIRKTKYKKYKKNKKTKKIHKTHKTHKTNKTKKYSRRNKLQRGGAEHMNEKSNNMERRLAEEQSRLRKIIQERQTQQSMQPQYGMQSMQQMLPRPVVNTSNKIKNILFTERILQS